MAMLNGRMDENVLALERENMKLEVIFRELVGADEYLYWFSVQGDSSATLETSPFEVDRLHIAFADECLDHDYGRRDAQTQVVMVPTRVADAMHWANPELSVVQFERAEIIRFRPEPPAL